MVLSISTSTVINLHLKIINPMSIRTDFVTVIQMQITIQYNYNTNLKCKMLVSMEPPKTLKDSIFYLVCTHTHTNYLVIRTDIKCMHVIILCA